MYRITEIGHHILKGVLKKDMIVIDATLGNGYDTLFLAPYVSHVYAFDIQEDAIKTSKKRLSNYDNITMIHDSFVNINHYVKDYQGVIYNLGYLPKGDKSITTRHEDVLLSLKIATEQLKKGGFIMITIYRGHDEGAIESESITQFLHTLSLDTWAIGRYDLPFLDRTVPYIYYLYKKTFY